MAIPLDDLPQAFHARFAELAHELSMTSADKPSYGNPQQAIGAGLETEMNIVFRSARFHGALHSLLGPDFMVGNNWYVVMHQIRDIALMMKALYMSQGR